uniref:Uncharacterized protein n=1 Tax=Tanacetum cinerariifolium TaxID=118510 RepID=A0A699LAZ1_TANCI|nr:hypothetical protein [Tanacetum cinerariifolium]
MYPRFIQLIIQNQLGNLSTHSTRYTSPALNQKVFDNMRRVGKGCSGVETPLFEGMLVEMMFTINLFHHLLYPQVVVLVEFYKVDLEITKLKTRVKKLERANKVKALKLKRLKMVRTSQRIKSFDDIDMEDASNQGRIIDELDRDIDVSLMEAVEVVTTAKLITKVVVAVSESVTAASATTGATITAAPVRVAAAFTRRRKEVVIRDPEEESTAKTPVETKSKDKGKGQRNNGQGGSICVEVPGDEEKASDRSSSLKEYDHVFKEYCWIQIGLL